LPGLLPAPLEKRALHALALALEHVRLGERGGVEVRRGDRALGGLAIVHEGRQGSTATVAILPREARSSAPTTRRNAVHVSFMRTPSGSPASRHATRPVADRLAPRGRRRRDARSTGPRAWDADRRAGGCRRSAICRNTWRSTGLPFRARRSPARLRRHARRRGQARRRTALDLRVQGTLTEVQEQAARALVLRCEPREMVSGHKPLTAPLTRSWQFRPARTILNARWPDRKAQEL
jgi:hypothetical protein